MLVPFLRRRQGQPNHRLFLWGGGIALPGLTLLALVPFALIIGQGTRADRDRLTVEVTGNQFWWAVAYREGEGEAIPSANELRLPAGESVELLLSSTDVIHSLWIPNLAGKTDNIPGRVTRMIIQADRPGIYRGQCAEFCGRQHALMALDVIAVPRAEFDAWLSGLAAPAPDPSTPALLAGRELFVSVGCAGCHTVRGVAEGQLGPDLTRVGGRRTIGAGTLRNGPESLADWIAHSQLHKPGNAMPSFDHLPPEQLASLASWLDSLK